MNRSPARCALLLLACALHLLIICFDAANGSVLASESNRDTRLPRVLRRTPEGDGAVEARANAIDHPLDHQLQLKYYDVVAVDLLESLPEADGSGSLVVSGAGEGKPPPEPGASIAAPAKSESTKTLADQVAEGKYGLIHRELFQRRPQRLGVLNYRRNEEVPSDDERNYGGLRPDEIWLAEDHLLVLKGGSISFGSNRSAGAAGDGGAWQPIDDYRAPERQVQIPANPAVPPPFPVQLRENGPIEFIRGDQVPAFNPFTNESAFLFTNKAFPVIRPEDFGGQNILARPAAHNGTGQHNNGLQYPPPVNPPPVSDNRTYSNPFLKLPPPGPPLGPPVGRPPLGSLDDVPDNRTAGPAPPFGAPPADEDDPSLYYPPPYTFEYRGNYTNPVPPGPLVPGIILPPPPNFFILKPQAANASEPARNATATAGHREPPVKPTKGHRPATVKAPTAPTPSQTLPTSANTVSKIAPSRVEIQKAVLKTFVPVIEFYGGPANGGTTTLQSKPALSVQGGSSGGGGGGSKRQRVKPSVPPGSSTHATPTPLLTPSTKLHKIPAEVAARPVKPAAPSAAQPIYAEYFDIKTSTVGPPPAWGDAGSPVAQQPQQLPRTYLPVAVGKGGRGGGQPLPAQHPNPEFLSTTYGYSPIEQFHREVQTIRQTLQLYEKANKLTKAGRTSKARPVSAVPLQYHEPSVPSLANLSLTFGGNVYRSLFPEEVVSQQSLTSAGGGQAAYKGYSGDTIGGAHGQPYAHPYETPHAYVYRQPAGQVRELPQSYYVTTGEGNAFPASYGRHAYPSAPYGSDIAAHHQPQSQPQQHQQQQQQYHHQQHPAYYQPQHHQPLPKYSSSLSPSQPELSYIAPVILNNGASGYNRRPEFHGVIPTSTSSSSSGGGGSTTTKSYLILDHRHVQGPPAHRLRPDRQRQMLDLPYFYRSGTIGYENGEGSPGAGEPAPQPPGQRNRYLESDILVNYKHPLPVLNPDSEFLPYHHRLKVRKRQNVRGAGEHKPRQYFGQPLYNHR